MHEQRNSEIRRLQREIVGRRYEGATLSGIAFGGGNDGDTSISHWLKRGKNFLVVIGPPGVGKTYFCSALIEWIYGKVPSFRYWHEREFFTRIRGVIGSSHGEYAKEVENMLDDHFIMYDDLGSSGINDWRKEILLSMIDIRYELTKPTVITTNLTKQALYETLGVRSSSRIFDKSNLIIDISDMPDRRQINGNT